jgi:fructokinase
VKEPIRIAGIGEILMDVFEDGSATLGGAPFNVAFHAAQLLRSSGEGSAEIVSAVGADERGKSIAEAVKAAGFSTEYLAIDAKHPTGIANVVLSGTNAGFEIAPVAAWDYLTTTVATDELAASLSAVAFGSLAQRRSESGAMIREFVAGVPGHRLYDVNLRRNTTNGVRGYSREIIDKSCAIATIVKLNDGELAEICGEFGFSSQGADGTEGQWQQMAKLREHYKLPTVVLTRGAQGALLLSEDERIELPDSTLDQRQIHPVGAGDAFSAGLLYSLTQGLPLSLCARIADRLASWVTGFASATPALTPEMLREIKALKEQSKV